MPLHVLDDKIWFPPVEESLPDGLLAMGGDLSKERILQAYQKGIFPWYDGDVPLWWCPNPRFVLFPDDVIVSKSMRSVLKKNTFDFTINTAFAEVIHKCRTVNRKDQEGTWINNDIINTYSQLNKDGYAYSAEAWHHNELVGGLYGLLLGKVFFGESMFSTKANASKFAFIRFIEYLKERDIKVIDCQVYTEHLESLGARMIMREQFLQLLESYI
ncbi:MAG: leucyl/phenylalanyl-tRNA--protein transferase [Sphingobacteriia bacterium]|nr:leucyl/phenylalanyl-tRNA--protein transferase [Sphingobacteriia bacterium]